MRLLREHDEADAEGFGRLYERFKAFGKAFLPICGTPLPSAEAARSASSAEIPIVVCNGIALGGCDEAAAFAAPVGGEGRGKENIGGCTVYANDVGREPAYEDRGTWPRYAVLAGEPLARRWLSLLDARGRDEKMLDAYGRAVDDFLLLFLRVFGVATCDATEEHVAQVHPKHAWAGA